MLIAFSQIGHIFGAESGGGIAALGVDVKALVLQIITFVIVFLLLKKFALAKIIKVLEKRQETIDKGVELGREMVEEKARLEEKIDRALQKARAEADKIIAAGHSEATALIKQAEDDAAKKVNTMLADAKSRMDDDIELAKRTLEKETLRLVAEVSEVVLQEKMSSSKDTQLIERALHEAKQS